MHSQKQWWKHRRLLYQRVFRGGLIIPAKIVTDFVSKAFAILDFWDEKFSLTEREGAQLSLDYLFSCKTHAEKNVFNNFF